MYKNGVYFGKFMPPHRGHLSQIIHAATKCENLHIVISHSEILEQQICDRDNVKPISVQLRKQWLSQETQNLEHIKIHILNETDLPLYPNGWVEWSDELQKIVNENIDVFFVGEEEYKPKLNEFFPNADVDVFDHTRSRYPISATEIRKNPHKHWDYIIGSARPHFAKRVLIVGTESCMKTTLTKYLAKLYNTSWSEEVGRYYARDYLGGDETIFTDTDFMRIAHLQYEQDFHALRTANKVAFFDTDATATNYFSELYMGHRNGDVERYINPNRYDLVLFLTPDVKWVDDGQRLNGGDEIRSELNNKLLDMYCEFGFKDKIEIVSGNYEQRLNRALELVDKLLERI